ncbi:dTMP kinase [Laceyella sacchari]|uniref:Thymidylate kinase n=2 Tax=Laceyella TaxID=292635 RepID=A0AA46AGW1_9BACL|nr:MULTISPECIES: dTMP kinase [Laceyella]AUS07514.1 dTMP kinase [Laceyella sacchari]MRG27044.1 dTMP kinase [Laceyella tengchongensis]PRZ13200.1 dTMP kinase [Laceyella sediminis]SMP31162.1 dTMP kinase [Laceyella tengchongensis]
MRGLFITFEGPEGAGKSTQINRLAQNLKERGIPCVQVREPGGTYIGDLIRSMVLHNPECSDMKQRTETLLYAASRAQLVEEVIRPALARGEVVLSDRYVDSSLAYQGHGARWSLDEIRWINHWATNGLVPDRTYLLDVPVELGEERMQKRGLKKDRMESKEKMFHERVRSGYLSLAQEKPERYVVLDGRMSVEKISERIMQDFCSLAQIKS